MLDRSSCSFNCAASLRDDDDRADAQRAQVLQILLAECELDEHLVGYRPFLLERIRVRSSGSFHFAMSRWTGS
jgi:hypothetical protein